MVRLVDFDGQQFIVADHVCAIEKGEWSNGYQDWYATLVCIGNTRITTQVLMKRAKELLEASSNPTSGNRS